MFLLETDRLQKQLSELVSKAETAQTNLDETNLEYEKIKKEHSRIEEELEELNTSLDAAKEAASQNDLSRQQMENQIELLKEQIKSVRSGRSRSRTGFLPSEMIFWSGERPENALRKSRSSWTPS